MITIYGILILFSNTMGLMYWQLNDLWQTQSWSTVDYDLKWKIGHYVAQHMYEPVYPVTVLTPYLANVTDENAQILLYVVNDLFSGMSGQLICSVYAFNAQGPRIFFEDDVRFDAPGVQLIRTVSYQWLMSRAQCANGSECIFYCELNYNQQHIQQTLFLSRPKYFQLSDPHLRIRNIKQRTSTDFDITLDIDCPALFVWLDISTNITGYFSKNGFHLFGFETVSFHSWTPIIDFNTTFSNIHLSSLFDVTVP